MRSKNALVFALILGMVLQALPSTSVSSAAPVVSTSSMQQIDPAATYRLTNDYAGPGKSLTVVNRNNVFELAMTDSRQSDVNQQWKLVPLGNNKYRLTCLGTGPNQSLDTPKPGASYLIVMQGSGNYTGQMWSLTSVGNGKVRLTNDYATPSMSLDTPMSGNQYLVVLAGSGNYTGQWWTLTKIDGPVTAGIPAPQITTPIAITGATITSNAPAGTPGGPSSTSGTLVSGAGPIPSGGTPLVVTGVPANVPALSNAKGQALCIKGGAVICGNTKADWVGSHTLTMKCDRGFYDPIWGGTCWEAPSDGGRGAWIRSTTAVTKPDAFWRMPSEKLARAEKVKGSVPFAWDCPSGSFWDGYNGGACYKCPDGYPRRTANHIAEPGACATVIEKEETTAVFVKYNGCPMPDASKMNLSGKRTPGRPFLHIGSGCYTCPTTDEEGNVLITERNIQPITGSAYDNNGGCTILMKWKPAQFVEPGMAGIDGFQGALNDSLALTTPEILTFYFQKLATDKGYQPGSAESRQLVGQMWNAVATDPTKSVGLSTLMYGYLEQAISKDASRRTAAETAFVKGFSDYVTRRRTFIAEQALAMYDAWKAAEPTLRATVAQSQLQTAFYYGTVPLDFESAAAAGFGLAAAGLGTAGAVAASAAHASATLQLANVARASVTAANNVKGVAAAVQSATRSQALYSALANLANFRLLAVGSQIAMSVGPLAIAAVGSVLISIAIDQVIEIATARDKLNNAVEIAKQQADLNQLLSLADGRDQLAYFWSRAIDGTSASDNQIRSLAARVAAEARTNNYEIPAPAAGAAPPANTGAASPFGGLLNEYRAATTSIAVQPSSVPGLTGIWGVNASGAIKRGNSSGQWETISGGLSQIAAGFDNSVFGVNAGGQVWQWTGSTWKLLPGGLVKVSVQSANRIAGVNGNGQVWTFDGATWTMIAAPMQMKDVAIASDGYLFATGLGDQIFRSSGPVTGAGTAGWTWNQLPGGGSKIAASTKDLALTVNSVGELWIWKGGTWTNIGTNFTNAAMSKNAIWGWSRTQGLVRMDASGWVPMASEPLTSFGVAWSF